MDDPSLDTRDLRFLWSLLETGSLVRTAELRGLSHAASCRTLARLREAFNDKLFVKSGQGLAPSPRALALKPQVRRVMLEMNELLSPAHFDASSSTRCFRLALVDNAFVNLCGAWIPDFVRLAPKACLEIRPLGDDVLRNLKSGELDAAVCIRDALPADFHRQTLVTGDFVCLVRHDHPLMQNANASLPPSLEEFHRFGRLEVRVLDAKDHPTIEQRSGMPESEAQPAVVCPYYVGACSVLAATDLVMVVHRSTAERFAARLPLAFFPTPWPSLTYTSRLVWHDRVHADPAMRWMRERFIRAIRDSRDRPTDELPDSFPI